LPQFAARVNEERQYPNECEYEEATEKQGLKVIVQIEVVESFSRLAPRRKYREIAGGAGPFAAGHTEKRSQANDEIEKQIN